MILFSRSFNIKSIAKIFIISTLLLTYIVPGVFAGSNDLGVVISNGSGLPGDQVSVTISLQNVAESNAAIGTDGICSSNFTVTYDSNALQVGTISKGSLFTSLDVDYSSSKPTVGKITFFSNDNTMGENLVTSNGTYATINFTIKSGTPAADYPFYIESNAIINGLVNSSYEIKSLPIQKTLGKITVNSLGPDPVTPPAPNVTRDDSTNTVTGMAIGMEYKLDDAAAYVVYNEATFESLNLAGNHTLLVRVAAEGINPEGPDTILTFTTDPVTPAAPNVTRDDTANTVTGMAIGMEYKLDDAAYVAYNAATFANLNLAGNHTLLVRVAAEGINPEGPATTLTFSDDPVDECFIATAAFGSKNQTDVVLLRHFRDQFLLTNPIGKAFVETYYHYSPPIARTIAGDEVLRLVTRVLLLPFVAIVYMLFHPVLLVGILAGIAFMISQRRRYKVLNAK